MRGPGRTHDWMVPCIKDLSSDFAKIDDAGDDDDEDEDEDDDKLR